MTTYSVNAYPLQWPAGWPVTTLREASRFKTTLSGALSELKTEVERLGGKSLVLSSNYTLGNERPSNPGVVAYFILREKHIAIPCDRWNRVECNVHAITLTIEAMRGMERWGAKHMITAMFTGFQALPEKTTRPWWEVLGVPQSATMHDVNSAYREKAKVCHPDAGGTREQWDELRSAQEIALKTVHP